MPDTKPSTPPAPDAQSEPGKSPGAQTEPQAEPNKPEPGTQPDTSSQAEPSKDTDTSGQASPGTTEPSKDTDTSAKNSPGENQPTAETDSERGKEKPGTPTPQTTDELSFANRSTFHDQMSQRLDRIDMQLRVLETKGDASSDSTLQDLKQRRDAVATEIENMDKQTEAGWVEYRTQVQDSLDKIEKDLDKAASP